MSDVADRPRELATDADWIRPGDGDFRLQPVFEQVLSLNHHPSFDRGAFVHRDSSRLFVSVCRPFKTKEELLHD